MDILALLPLLLTGFVMFWLGMFEILSRAGGWKRVARRYPAAGVPEGRKFSWQYCAFGWVDYNGCVTIVVGPDGVYLRLWPLIRFSHPPLLLPWSALHVLKAKSTGWVRQVQLAIDGPPLARLKLPYKVVEAAQELMPAWKEAGDAGV